MKAVCLYIFLLATLFQPLNGQTLNDYFEIAADNNPALHARYKSFEAALQKIPQANGLPDPSLSFGYFISPVETRVGPQRARFSLSQMFPWFGTLKAQEDVFALVAEARYQDFLNSRNMLYYQVSAAYYPLYELEELIRLEQENIDILTSYKNIATTRFESGKASMVDVYRVDIQLKEATTNWQILLDKRKPLRAQLNELLNREANAPVSISDTLILSEFDQEYRQDSLFVNHPLMEELELKIKANESAEEVAIKNGLPRIGLGLDYIIVGKQDNINSLDNGKNALMPMLSLSLPIYRSKHNASITEAQLTRESLTLQKEALSNNLSSRYEMIWFELAKQRRMIGLYEEQITQSEQSLNLLLVSYGNSGKDFEEILRMQQQLLEYRKMKLMAAVQSQINLAELDYITSKSY